VYSTGLAKVGALARRASFKWGLAGAVVLHLAVGAGSLGVSGQAAARGPQGGELPAVAIGSLPAEAQTTYQLIHAGGPFPYEKDGTVFLNRERLLPPKNRGHYREYTVKTPRARNRGARRIVCGGPAKAPQDCYYTADHYASFSRITAP
jgi:ribonuclease T1